MRASIPSRLLLIALSLAFTALGVYLLLHDTLTIPGRLTMNRYLIERNGLVLFSSAAFTVSFMFVLLAINKQRFKNLSTNLFIIGFLLFTIGYFI